MEERLVEDIEQEGVEDEYERLSYTSSYFIADDQELAEELERLNAVERGVRKLSLNSGVISSSITS
jgi:hypothetical protein